jgi:hypothetical protein
MRVAPLQLKPIKQHTAFLTLDGPYSKSVTAYSVMIQDLHHPEEQGFPPFGISAVKTARLGTWQSPENTTNIFCGRHQRLHNTGDKHQTPPISSQNVTMIDPFYDTREITLL